MEQKNCFQSHRDYLIRCLKLAKTFSGQCFPNPAVGALIVKNGKIISEGWHEGKGKPHAERNAFSKLQECPEGATIYITLEPCCHWGVTPPCVDAIIEHKISKVIFSQKDPNSLVNGQSIKILEKRGIKCIEIPVKEISSFYEGYSKWHLEGVPKVIAKLAMSLNGKIAGKKGERINITGKFLNDFTHHQRKEHDAILTTAATIIKDNPMFNARINGLFYPKDLYILNSRLNLPSKSNIFSYSKHVTLFCNPDNIKNKNLYKFNNVECISIPSYKFGLLDIKEILKIIGRKGVHNLWVEAGGLLTYSLVHKKLVDVLYLYLSPQWLNPYFTDGFQKEFDFRSYFSNITYETFGGECLIKMSHKY
ncbi:MAG: bifunctional diaminohydroxyphosphoribosylaminopyrimidine deaminase/5-amino-6-(5-phosphoribosylamino)uracil reductase RibD [Proteobacteria bacterium]|nr:bifunctional diaminohydroxyphosphoribosylaminopyrimidine deaminase/5-amino-6-(5-phosphoribosylamino)uracil reductase RibD [Pseudomonadota bacterium]